MCCLDYIINLAIQAFLFYNVIEMKKMKAYNKLEKLKELEDETKQKFQLLESLDKLHNIIVNTCSFANCIAEFLELAARMISLDNCTQ